jgi:hypothetical protein
MDSKKLVMFAGVAAVGIVVLLWSRIGLPGRSSRLQVEGTRLLDQNVKTGVQDLKVKTGVQDLKVKTGVQDLKVKTGVQDLKVKTGVQDLKVKTGVQDLKVKTGVQDKVKTKPRSLAINMVIMPFLRYGAKEDTTLEREEEYKLCLRKNLAHPSVQHIHLLTIDSTDTQKKFKEFTSNIKLVVSEIKRIHRARDIYEYVSRNLLRKDVMIVNADIALGSGFDKIDAAVMDQQNIMYAISRHLAPEHDSKCRKDKSNQGNPNDMCENYIGSHDAFMFRLDEPLTEEFLQHMDFPYPNPGMEGRMIWSFENVLKYCVLNPCSILKTFHYHCSQLRTYTSKPRLNSSERYTVKSPSSHYLYCK